MRFGKQKLILVALTLAVLGGFFIWSRMRDEPEFQGRTVSSWFQRYYRSTNDQDTREEAKLALCALGTNAVPFLLGECFSDAQDSTASTNFLTFLAHLPGPFRFPPFVSADEIREAAAEMLHEINPPATFILPDVSNSFNGTSQARQRMAIYLLGDIGADAQTATPWLKRGLCSSDTWQIMLALQSTERLGPAAKEVVPDLIAVLTNVPITRQFTWGVCKALGSMGHDASPAIPLLKERFLAETNLQIRLRIAGALCCISTRESEPLRTLLAEVSNGANKAELRACLFPLGEIGPAAKDAIPFLVGLLSDPDVEVCFLAANALYRIGADKSTILPPLLGKLENGNDTIQYNVAMRILSIDPANPQARATLLTLIRQKSPFARLATAELGKLVPTEKPAISLLRELSLNGDQWEREGARKALKRIESREKQAH